MDTILILINFEPTKPLELNESDGLWTVNVQSSFGQISLPQDWLKSFFTIVDQTYAKPCIFTCFTNQGTTEFDF